MKIIILSDDFPPKSLGGAGIVAYMQAKELSRRGHEVSVITTFQDEGIDERVDIEGLTVYRIHTNYNMFFRGYVGLCNPKTIFKVKKFLEDMHPDVVHAHNIHQFLSYKILDYAKQYAKKVCVTFHDGMSVHYTKLYPKVSRERGRAFDYRVSWFSQLRHFRLQYNPFRNSVIKHYLKNVDYSFAVSHALKDALEQNGLKKIEVLHNGIDVEDFIFDEGGVSAFKNKYDLCDKKVLFFSGRISKTKGIDVCLHLLKELSLTMPEVRLLIAGKKNSYIEHILQKEDMLGLASKVIFTEWLDREEVVSAYYASDLIPVLSTYLDPFPTTNLEAMATKKPVLGTCFGGTPEIVVDGQTGYIVDPNNFGEVLRRASQILSDEGLAKKLGEAGHERVAKNYLLSTQANHLETVYGTN